MIIFTALNLAADLVVVRVSGFFILEAIDKKNQVIKLDLSWFVFAALLFSIWKVEKVLFSF